jgi:two-component system sensor histidine kinase RstB
MIRQDMDQHLTDEQRLLLNLADRGLQRLKSQLDPLRLLADLELARLELAREQIDLVSLVERGVAAVTAVEPRDRIQLTLRKLADTVYAEVDANKVAQAIAELLSNALRHAHRCVRVTVGCEGAQACVIVEDDGDGIPVVERSELFRRFGRRSTRLGGGIGLSIAHDLIHAQGGNLSCQDSTLPSERPGGPGMKFVMSFNPEDASLPAG